MDNLFKKGLPAYITRALQIIKEAGGRAWLVGGCVRDAMLGAEPYDFDVATDLTPDAVVAAFGESRTVKTGIRHGTVTAVLGDGAVEITTLRRDAGYSDSRHPDGVSFVCDIEVDLARRDFTVNAAAWSPDGGLTDPFGAQSDLRAGIIRCVGDPRERFGEDALRILRALRFASVLGFEIEKETSDALLGSYRALENISKERVRAELVKLICGKNAAKVLLDYREVVGFIIPELVPCMGYDASTVRHKYDVYEHCVRTAAGIDVSVARLDPGDAGGEAVLRLAGLFHDVGKPYCPVALPGNGVGFPRHETVGAGIACEIMRRLRFDRDSVRRVGRIIVRHDRYPKPDRDRVRRDIVDAGKDLWWQIEALHRADNAAKAEHAYSDDETYFRAVESIASSIYEDGDCLDPSELQIGGTDLLGLGASGVALGDVRRRLFDEVVDGKLQNDRDALILRAKILLAEAPAGNE